MHLCNMHARLGKAGRWLATYQHNDLLKRVSHSSEPALPMSLAPAPPPSTAWRPVAAPPPGDRPRPAAAVSAMLAPCSRPCNVQIVSKCALSATQRDTRQAGR